MFAMITLCIQLAFAGATQQSVEYEAEQMIAVQEENILEEDFLDEISFGEIQEILDDILSDDKIRFQQLVIQLINGEKSITQVTGEELTEAIENQWSLEKQDILYLFLLAVSASVFSVFTEALKEKQISDIWFYIVYMIASIIVFKAFGQSLEYSVWSAQSLTSFMQVLVPAYALSVTMAVGAASGAGFYQCTLILIYILGTVIENVLLPIIKAYVVLKILNHISEEDILSKLAELFAGAVKWMIKTTMTVLVGFQVVQSLLAPAIDSLKHTSFSKTVSALPGIGSAAGAVAELLLGSAILVKNGIGTAAILVVLVICVPPLLKIAVFTVSYKVVAAMIQPVADKRFTGCIAAAAEGGELLFQATAMMAGMFMISIALVALRG